MKSLMSARLSFMSMGMVIGSFSLAFLFTMVNIQNIYTNSICFIGLCVGGVIGYFKGREIDKKEEK
jgi:hypothetical protein